MKTSIAASSRWAKGRFSHFLPSSTNENDIEASSTDDSSVQGKELHHRKNHEEENNGTRPKKPQMSTSTLQIETRQDEDEDEDRIVIKPVNDEDDTSVIITFNQSISPFIITLTFVASISGFMFGYDTGYISSALISINKDLDNKELTYGEREIITAATSLGALITSIGAGTAADVFGRRPCLMFSNLMFLIGAILQLSLIHI